MTCSWLSDRTTCALPRGGKQSLYWYKRKHHALFFLALVVCPCPFIKKNTEVIQLYLAAEAFVDACDGFQQQPQACEEGEGGAGSNEPRAVPPPWARQTREAGSQL